MSDLHPKIQKAFADIIAKIGLKEVSEGRRRKEKEEARRRREKEEEMERERNYQKRKLVFFDFLLVCNIFICLCQKKKLPIKEKGLKGQKTNLFPFLLFLFFYTFSSFFLLLFYFLLLMFFLFLFLFSFSVFGRVREMCDRF